MAKRLYGVTHTIDGERIERQVRILKVGIGVPSQGPDVHVFITQTEKPWNVEVGSYEQRSRRATVQQFKTRGEAEAFYSNARRGAPKCVAPRRLDYFTFTRTGIDGLTHDFDAIELHGARPNEIDIVFLSDDPFDPHFAMYSKSELKCKGDGIDAMRKLSMATPAQARLVQIAQARGDKYFPIIGGCYARGCQYPKEGACKPHTKLYFQLPQSPRIGGTCTFDTTGFRSTSQLDACIDAIKTVTGRGDPENGVIAGIPLKLVMRPYQANYTDGSGQARTSTQYAVSLEYRATNVNELGRLLIHSAYQFRETMQLDGAIAGFEPLQLNAAGAIDVVAEEPVELTDEQRAADEAAISNEFYPEVEGEGDGHGDRPFDRLFAGPSTQMPQRKSAQTAAPVTEATPAEDALEIGGVVFPDRILAENDDERMTSLDYDLLAGEAARAGLVLITYCESLLGLKPTELTSAAAQSLLQVMANAPTNRKK